jgi:multiple sugar transport system permease protein
MTAQSSARTRFIYNWPGWLATIGLALGAVIMMLPFLWMFSTSLRPLAESFKLPPSWLPTSWVWDNYAAVFRSSVPVLNFALNSLIVTASVTLGQVITCSLAGFAFARLRFPGRNVLFILLLASLMVPAQVTIIPLFIVMRSLDLVDNLLALILPGLFSAFGVFLMRQFFMALPQDLTDAAKIDGSGPFTLFMRIALPLAGPVIATLVIITFNANWNAYYAPYIFINTWEKMTLPLGITALRGYMASGNPAIVMAAVTMVIIPVLVIFLLAQRWIIAGITRTGLRG